MRDKESIEKFLMHGEAVVKADPTISYMIVTRRNQTGALSILFYRGCNDIAAIAQTITELRRRQHRTVVDVFFPHRPLIEQVAACAAELHRQNVAAAA